jgi:uncharacterized membrane protein YfcA
VLGAGAPLLAAVALVLGEPAAVAATTSLVSLVNIVVSALRNSPIPLDASEAR